MPLAWTTARRKAGSPGEVRNKAAALADRVSIDSDDLVHALAASTARDILPPGVPPH